MLTAALCHDMGHEGHNNGFLVASSSPLALLYNDTSVLENMHVALAFRAMRDQPECNLLESLSGDMMVF